jgi:hypothetical protein
METLYMPGMPATLLRTRLGFDPLNEICKGVVLSGAQAADRQNNPEKDGMQQSIPDNHSKALVI